MFTGLIEKTGKLSILRKTAGGAVITISHDPWDTQLEMGESVAVQGVCLTVVDYEREEFTCDVLEETLVRTNLQGKQPGSALNMERALQVGGRVGGHFVSGHVDGVGKVIDCRRIARDWLLEIACEKKMIEEIVPKGSITCDGISLTVTKVHDLSFEVNIIPFTWQNTSMASIVIGDSINLETDILGKYVRKYIGVYGLKTNLNIDTLKNAGFC